MHLCSVFFFDESCLYLKVESSDFKILLWHFNTSHEFLDFVGLEMLFLIRL